MAGFVEVAREDATYLPTAARYDDFHSLLPLTVSIRCNAIFRNGLDLIGRLINDPEKDQTDRKGIMLSILLNRVHTMETIQVVLDTKLLHAADRAARRTKQNRSALIREALREYLRRLEYRTMEERDREGYTRHPDARAEALIWEGEAAWPEE